MFEIKVSEKYLSPQSGKLVKDYSISFSVLVKTDDYKIKWFPVRFSFDARVAFPDVPVRKDLETAVMEYLQDAIYEEIVDGELVEGTILAVADIPIKMEEVDDYIPIIEKEE